MASPIIQKISYSCFDFFLTLCKSYDFVDFIFFTVICQRVKQDCHWSERLSHMHSEAVAKELLLDN
jgi:hypothetical protein